MTKGELEKLKALKQEAKQLQEELKHMPLTTDSVKGSMVEFPYTERSIKIEGIDENKAKRLRKKLERKLDNIQDIIDTMEDWLDSVGAPETRTILRLTYRNGLTQEQTATEMGYSEKTIQRKLKAFWKDVL